MFHGDSSRVTVGLLAASLISALLPRPVTLGGRHVLTPFTLSHHSHILISLLNIKANADMTTKPRLLLCALTFCCILGLQAYSTQGCNCINTIPGPISPRVIQKVEVIPVSGRCRWLEIIVTTRRGKKICLDPKGIWVNNLFSNLQRRSNSNSSMVSSASIIN
ncbi:C-X-C motif chemokine 10-like [Notolabrus celidotus]|uniref:C-X-C motif chemokine 10-like n=1 Tax=Notolabrus celidotus TaxID=1203425 RepID=UPI0014902115|nr:C-X-C motif chemokine 10-like [Notolabrus celidotus]